MNKTKIIVTGLSGLLGSRLKQLLSSDYDFVDFSLETGVDITKPSLLKEKFKQNSPASIVLHLAAFTDTTAAWQQRGDKKASCYQVNVVGSQNILNCCQQFKKHLIYFSTDFVFDGKKKTAYTETDTPSPLDWYGQTKFLAEDLILKSGLSASIIRIAFPFRSHFEPKKDIVRKTIESLKNSTLYPMFTDQIITPTFIDDIVLSLNYFFQNQPCQIFHLVGSTPISPYQLAVAVAKTFGFDPSSVKKGLLADYVKKSAPDARPWAQNLALSNQKVKDLGLDMKDLSSALQTMKTQINHLVN
ncbi:sugar nucleotide-binding protein [Patescibacteria group bacterium]|nr:sugar nucleotide-binding protein [Patescibacteria group bacterium]